MQRDTLGTLQALLDNTLDHTVSQRSSFAGIFGATPSVSAKSPHLWNAAFKGLEMDAVFLPFDVADGNLPALVAALRDTPNYLGGSVTVPYKTRIMPLLDELDIKAEQIGAVNTVGRLEDGRLIGYNTDAQGAVDSLTKTMPWQQHPFMPSLAALKVLLIGAGGAGKAVAFAVAEEIRSSGHLIIVNRSEEAGSELAKSVGEAYGNASSVPEDGLSSIVPEMDLVINASLKGQSGLRSAADGLVSCLEPYSALAAANPAMLRGQEFAGEEAIRNAWFRESMDDILENQARSARVMSQLKPGTPVLDIIFSPLETTLLAHARWAGHPTLNGRGMNLAQAVDGFVNRVMRGRLLGEGRDIDQLYNRVVELMAQEW